MTTEVQTIGYAIQPDKYSWVVVRKYLNRKGEEVEESVSWHRSVEDASMHLHNRLIREQFKDDLLSHKDVSEIRKCVSEATQEVLKAVGSIGRCSDD